MALEMGVCVRLKGECCL